MTRAQNTSDRNVSADPTTGADNAERSARLLDQSEIIDVFDEAIRLRFGKMITAAVLKSSRHWH